MQNELYCLFQLAVRPLQAVRWLLLKQILFIGFTLCMLPISHLSGQSLYQATGKASFYAKRFDGHHTSNGEIFSNKQLTAAHRTLPFGTVVRVTNMKNCNSIVVRINDRGPYVRGRLIDLSQAAADSLDFKHAGTTLVLIEEIAQPSEIDTTLVVVKSPEVIYDSTLFDFPVDWGGDWEGDLKSFFAEGLLKKIPFQLNISPASAPNRYRWMTKSDTSIFYRELAIHPEEENKFSLDEKNGIDIPCFILENHFICRYERNDSIFQEDYALLSADEISFQFTGGPAVDYYSTGNVLGNNDLVPEINAFRLTNLQLAILHRRK